MLKDLLKKIGNPSADFHGAPFWAWNGKLFPEELRGQIRLMKEMGLGGFFMHSRVGLNTPYLGKEWFECIRACIDEAKKCGMNAWLYDEDRWPSGAAGGLVTKNPAYRMQFLQLSIVSSPKEMTEDTSRTLGLYAGIVTEKGDASKLRKLASPSAKLKKGESLLYITRQVTSPNSWYNDQTYLDVMNPAAVCEFIKVTHESYKKHEKSEFGKTIPGIFSDEPTYSQGFRGRALPWTEKLPEYFRKKYSYSILDHLPELFCVVDGEEFSKARLDFYNCVTELFVNAFSKQIGEWCGKNNLEYTGHVLCEDELMSQRNVVGAAMRFYEYMQTPGIDLLTEHWRIFNTAKQCVSMAHQFGRKTRLSETYGCTGWDFPLFGHKALGDWQMALGINLRCQHLAWYTMSGEAKRDYPASIFYQSPWYKEYPYVENYFARIGAFLSEGEEVRDLLVIHPIESAFGLRNEVFAPQSHLNKPIVELTNLLLAEHLDFDFGDEEVMSRHASVKQGKIAVAKASYKAVLVPQLETIRKSTLELLEKFAMKGGKVFFLGKAPARVDGTPCTCAEEIFGKYFVPVTEKTLSRQLSPVVRTLSVKAGKSEIGPVLYQMRRGKDFTTLFLCNTGKEFGDQFQGGLVRDRTDEFPEAEITVFAEKNSSVWEMDPETGSFSKVRASFRNGKLSFKTAFCMLSSRAFLISEKAPANVKKTSEIPAKLRTVQKLASEKIAFTLDEENLLVLDSPAWAVGKGKKHKSEFFIDVDDKLRTLLGKRPRGGRMCQPWTFGERKAEKSLDLKLEYTFRCLSVPEGNVYLAVENPEFYSFTLNGKAFKAKDTGFWCDHAIRKLELPSGGLKKGTNTIVMRSRYNELQPGLESMFLLGNFGVKNGVITKKPAAVGTGDWVTQGFENYAGSFTYHFEYECKDPAKELYLRIREWRGAALGVSMNGSERRLLAWAPFIVPLKGKLVKGKNVISITVFGHRRNAFGPFYLNEKWPRWTGPGQFRSHEVTKRQLVPCGLLKAVEIVR